MGVLPYVLIKTESLFAIGAVVADFKPIAVITNSIVGYGAAVAFFVLVLFAGHSRANE
jgi:hypothetical protein